MLRCRSRPVLLCGPRNRDEPGMADTNDLLAREYEAINAHLRGNIGQFVNWFSFFLTASFVALAVFVAVGDRWPEFRMVRLRYAVPGVFLFLHVLAFIGRLSEILCGTALIR